MPVDDNISLLTAICNQPDDDDVRLVYADWLDDHGDETRAEFIRLQCARKVELTPHPWFLDSDRPHRYPFIPPLQGKDPPEFARQLQLYRNHVRKWNGAIHRRLRHTQLHRQIDSRRGLIRGWTYRRGFPCALWAEAKAVADHAAAVFAIGPIERLNLVGPINISELERVLRQLDVFPLKTLDVNAVAINLTMFRMLQDRNRFPCLGHLRLHVAGTFTNPQAGSP